MNTAKIATALNTISVAFGELAEALGEAPQATRAVLRDPGPTAAEVHEQFDDLGFPPNEYEAIPLPAETPGLGRCPSHNLAWSVKAAGVSKMGKPYNAFFHCDGKEPDGSFCPRKPVKAWADAHPIAA